jgi:hypothetical protein
VTAAADVIRARLRFLHEQGDAATFPGCWQDTDDRLADQFGWVLDLGPSRVDWPADCFPEYRSPK